MLHKTWLASNMRTTGTWPTPIIVLDNEPSLNPTYHRLQLIEGHTRLGYLRTLVEQGTAQPVHAVWRIAPPRS